MTAIIPELALSLLLIDLTLRGERFIKSDRQAKLSLLQALWVRLTWRRLARVVGLSYKDPTPTLRAWVWRRANPKEDQPHVVVPRVRVRYDSYGVVVRARPLPGVDREAWERAGPSLAASWRCARVGVSEDNRGRLVVRGVRRDPLTIPTVWTPVAIPDLSVLATPAVWPIGTDEYAEPVSLPLTNVAGVTVAGLPGSGKSSLLNGLIARLAPSSSAQICVLDGKGGQDYTSALPRLSAFCDDDLDAAHDLLVQLCDLRRARARVVRSFWDTGPTPDLPLMVVVIDEAHSYFAEFKGTDQETRRLASLAGENRRLVEELAKKGRSAGLLVVLATQKPTSDSLPTAIRDVCAASLSFAQSTSAASIAALGESVRDFPSADPMTLQGPAYVGVASMRLDGRPGFTRVRTPMVHDEDVAAVCQEHEHLAVQLEQLVPHPLSAVSEPEHPAPDEDWPDAARWHPDRAGVAA